MFQGGTAHPLSHTNHCGEQRAADDSPNKIWRGRQWRALPEWLYFYKQLLFSLWFSSVGPFLSGLLSFLPKSQCVADCMGRMWKLGLSSLSSTALLSCLARVILRLLWQGSWVPAQGGVGLPGTLVFIPGVGWNICELYFPHVGLNRHSCY